MRIEAQGLNEVVRDLSRIDRGIATEARRAMRAAGKVVLPEAKRRATVRTGGIARTLRVSTARRQVSIVSRHPGARTVHWGGRHPLFGDREQWFAQRPRPFIAQAADAKADEALRVLADELGDLFRRHGFKR